VRSAVEGIGEIWAQALFGMALTGVYFLKLRALVGRVT